MRKFVASLLVALFLLALAPAGRAQECVEQQAVQLAIGAKAALDDAGVKYVAARKALDDAQNGITVAQNYYDACLADFNKLANKMTQEDKDGVQSLLTSVASCLTSAKEAAASGESKASDAFAAYTTALDAYQLGLLDACIKASAEATVASAVVLGHVDTINSSLVGVAAGLDCVSAVLDQYKN